MTFPGDSVAIGGKPFYGAKLGILILECQFPRIIGDVGNANTWPFPVHYKLVRGSNVDNVVFKAGRGLLDNFIDAGKELIADGVDGIATSCGFLSIFQKEMADALDVPVATSSLLQAQVIQCMLRADQRVGIITFSSNHLTKDHLRAANVPEGTPVVGLENSKEFFRVIDKDEKTMDITKAQQDLLDAADRLVREHPDVGAILLECTNMSPYAHAISNRTGLPVFDVVSLINWFYAGLRPKNWALYSRSGHSFTDDR